jgi:hypothetical protein
MIISNDKRKMAIASANVAVSAMRRAQNKAPLSEQVEALASADTYLKRAIQQLTEARAELADAITDNTE